MYASASVLLKAIKHFCTAHLSQAHIARHYIRRPEKTQAIGKHEVHVVSCVKKTRVSHVHCFSFTLRNDPP